MWSMVQQRERVYAWLKAMRDSWDNYALRAVETIMLWERRDHTGVLGTSSHQSNCLELLHFLAAAPSLSSIWPGYNNAIRRHTRHSADAAETAMGTSSLYCTVLYCTHHCPLPLSVLIEGHSANFPPFWETRLVHPYSKGTMIILMMLVTYAIITDHGTQSLVLLWT